MKRLFSCLILCSLAVVVGCSNGSDEPSGSPRTANDVWQITALEASDSNPVVNTAIAITATVTLNGSPAPDNTQVEFITNGGVFSNGQTLASVLSSGGQATIGFAADTAGTYTVQARVKTVTRQIQIVYRNPDTSGGLQMYSINPRSGSYYGGETVVMTGKGIRNPVEVYFTVQGVTYQAIVDQVVPSVPLTGTGTITARTPEPTAADTTVTSDAEVRIVVGVGTPDEESESYPSAFTYIGNIEPPGDVPPTPIVFGVEPYYGRSAGGETVTILGMYFTWENPEGETEPTFFPDQVSFRFRGEDILAEVERWGAGQIEVITPRFSLTPLTDDENAGVVLIPTNGEAPVVKDNVFIVKTDVAQPAITGLSPTAGPLDGGTIVTITGHGFEIPVQVLFGDLEATDIQVYDDQSLADNDVITCRTPDYSQQGQVPPVVVSVRVTNLQTGNNATSSQTFRFGDLLYVGQANPTEGQIGDLFALYGAGFEDPLTVWYRAGGEIEFDVIQVTGTELTLRSPTDMEPTCNDRSGDFRVVLNQSNQEATGGTYTLLGSNPTVTAVDPIFVQSTDNGNGVTPAEIDIYGARFKDELLVRINNYTIAPSLVTVESSEHIHVDQIPAPNDFGLVFSTTSCTTGSGLQGVRQVPTPVNVTVRNLPLGCENTLSQTLVYMPEDDSCEVAPVLTLTMPNGGNFAATAAGTCSPAQTLTVRNDGAGTLDVQSLFLQGRFYFDAGASIQTAGPLTVPPFSFDDSLEIYFCPDVPTGSLYTGQITITSNNPGSPNSYSLTGLEATPPEITTNPYGNGDTWSFPNQTVGDCTAEEILTISNIGVSTLSVGPIIVSDTQFVVTVAPPGQLAPGASADLRMQFCPSAAGLQEATLSISHDAANEPNPIVINLTGNGT